MTVESTTQALCDLALRFGEGEEESMVTIAHTLDSIRIFLVAFTVFCLEFLIENP